MIVKNVQNIDVPEYLNEDFFINALEDGLREVKVTIDEINFEWGSYPGDNYCSRIYRVLVKFERLTSEPSGKEQRSLIIKTIPITQETRFLEDVGVFIKEKLTFVDVIPRLEILSNGDKFSAKCLYTVKAPTQTIVFNDLKVDGYRLASRQDGLDWAHCELILKQLGKLHATSMVLAKKDPAIVKRFQKGMLCPETVLHSESFSHMFGSSLEYLAKATPKWPGFEKIAPKLQNYSDRFKEITAQLAMPKEGDRYKVLNHGDMWTSNAMFAYNDVKTPQKPTGAIFVDFQLSFYGSPACDLNFFLNTSVQLELLKTRRNDLIATYYSSFSETLQYLRFESIPSMDDLQHELRSRELYGLFALYGFLPIVTMPKELSEDSNLESYADEDYKRKKMEALYAREKLQNNIKYSLKRMDDLGVLDDISEYYS